MFVCVCVCLCLYISGTEKTLMERKALLRSIKDCSQPKLLLEDAHSLRLLVYDVFNSSTYNFEENDTKVLEVRRCSFRII